MTIRAVIGLGSNRGNPEKMLLAAVDALERAPWVTPLALSSGYRTEPVGDVPQPPYLNAAVLVETELRPPELLALLLGIEAALGRRRTRRWGPRSIDLDLLLAGELISETPQLTLPHPRLRERPFALVPLLELLPQAAEPGSTRSYQSYLDELDRSGVGPARPLPAQVDRRDLNHTADFGFAVTGATKAATLERAAQALVELMVRRESVTERERLVVEAHDDDPVDLLVALLSEVVYLIDAQGFIPRRVSLLELAHDRVRLALFGEPLREVEQLVEHVKAVTYHGAELRRTPAGRWEATIIVDV